MIRWTVVLVLALSGLGAGWSSGGEDPAARRFEFVLDSHAKLEELGKSGTMPIDALTKFTYDLTPRPGAVYVSIHSIDLELKVGDDASTTHFDRTAMSQEGGGPGASQPR